LLKPEQGGSGARMYLLRSADELRILLSERSEIWFPDNLLLLQEYFEVDSARGIVRMEFLDGEFLYAMRVISHGSFNLCPSETCNPESGASMCEVPETKNSAPVEFHPYLNVPTAAVEAGKALISAGGLDVGGIEYLEANDGRLVFYDINANSNLREPIARSFGFNPFDRVAEFLSSKLS
jgi:glutathione synthase/RimK-type ligase-like ATP-grasp enzyme